MRSIVFAFAALAVSACSTPIGTEVARASARTVVNDVVEQRFPGVPITPVTDCAINNATGDEIVSIAGDAIRQQPSPETIELVISIASRPDAIRCFVEDAGPAVLPQILAGSVLGS
ncbi:MAG: succinate dehydrogenase [Pseudomonadota bacterium]